MKFENALAKSIQIGPANSNRPKHKLTGENQLPFQLPTHVLVA